MRVMLIIGIVCLVVAGASGYIALQPAKPGIDVGHEAAPILALTFGIIGVVFTLVGFFVTRMGAARQQLLEQGIPGRATVVSAAETGMYVNERPMVKLVLNVAVPGRSPYTVEHSEVIPFIALGMITPGSTLPVAVDQINPKKLVIDWSGETQARASAAMGGQMGFGGVGSPVIVGAGLPSSSSPGAMPTMSAVPGAPLPNTLSSMPGAAPNTLSSPAIPGAGASAAAGTSGGVGFALPLGLAAAAGGGAAGAGGVARSGLAGPGLVSGMSGGFGGLGGLNMSALMQQLGAAGVTFTGGMQVVNGGTTVVDARPNDMAAYIGYLRTNGHAGKALVRTANDMGIAIHGNQLVMLQVEVQPDTGASYPAQIAAMVPPTDEGKAVVGATLPVYIDQNNPQAIAIDWDAI